MIGLMIDPVTFRKSLEYATLEDLIKKRDELILEIRRYEKDKDLMDGNIIEPTPKFIYMMNKEYLSEVCNLINEKS